MRASSLSVGLMAAVVAFSAIAQQATPPPAEENPVVHPPSDPSSRFGDTPRMIVKFRSASPSGIAQIQSSATGEAASSAAATKFAARAGARVLETRALMAGMSTLRIESRAGESFAEQLARVRADSDVEFAVPDERRFPHALPSDPLFTGQWYLQSAQPSAINAQAAWDTSVGSCRRRDRRDRHRCPLRTPRSEARQRWRAPVTGLRLHHAGRDSERWQRS